MRSVTQQTFQKGGHDKDFARTSNVKEKLHKAAYEYIVSRPQTPKNYRDEETKEVYTSPRQVLVNPAKRGKTGRKVYLGGHQEYMIDDYNTLKKIATEARIEHEETILKVG